MAGEGCFRRTERRERFVDGSPRVRFVFELSLATPDRALLVALHAMLGGAGSIRDRGVRRSGWQPESCLTVASERLHLERTIPFVDRFLAPCHKRRQFEVWRDELLAYRSQRERLHPPGRATCRIEGCHGLVRGRGLCRRPLPRGHGLVMRPEFVAGLVVAEGCFSGDGGRRFSFTVSLAAVDAELCEALQRFFAAGHVYRYPRRAAHHDDVVVFTVQSRRELQHAIVPFMDRHLPPSVKRRQYERWRDRLGCYSPEAAGSSVTRAAQSTGEASDQRRSRS